MLQTLSRQTNYTGLNFSHADQFIAHVLSLLSAVGQWITGENHVTLNKESLSDRVQTLPAIVRQVQQVLFEADCCFKNTTVWFPWPLRARRLSSLCLFWTSECSTINYKNISCCLHECTRWRWTFHVWMNMSIYVVNNSGWNNLRNI